jgi:hypothetical protein
MDTIAQIGLALKNVFGECAEKANQEHRVIQRKRKFSVCSFAKTFVLAMVQHPDASYEDIATMAAICDTDVTKQAVEKRFTRTASEFFQSLFRHSVKQVVRSDQELAPLLERFTDTVTMDSSTIMLPDSQADQFQGRGGSHGFGKSALKLQTELSLRTGQLNAVDIEQGRESDMACQRQTIERPAGTLRLTDLGYFSIAVFASIAAAGSYFLSRIQWPTIVWQEGVRMGNVIDFLNRQKLNLVDQWIEIGTADRLTCRLIAWRVPESIAGSRRRKLYQTAKKRGRTVSSEALKSCDWMFLVTNLPLDKLAVNEAIVLYRARWQIELLFKRWKSVGLIGNLHGKNDTEQMVRLWAKLSAALIQHWLTVLSGWRVGGELSFLRIAKTVTKIAEAIAFALSAPEVGQELENVLKRFYKMTSLSTRRDKRKKIGTLELLQNPEKLDYVLS